jgi:hypothetical protein
MAQSTSDPTRFQAETNKKVQQAIEDEENRGETSGGRVKNGINIRYYIVVLSV